MGGRLNASVLRLSILIVNWNTEKYLRTCLESIYQNRGSIPCEVIVIDNHSYDRSVLMVRERFPDVNLQVNSGNLGYAKANNQATAIARGEFILLLNPDIIVQPDALAKLVSCAREIPRLGALTCRVNNIDGTFQSSFYRRFPTLATVFFYFFFPGRFLDTIINNSRHEKKYYYEEQEIRSLPLVDQAGASCLLLPRKVIEQIGLFDEQFPIYFNDVDLCKRIWSAGYEIHMLPQAAVIHAGGGAVRQLPFYKNYGLFYAGMVRYFKKHHGVVAAMLVGTLMTLNILLVWLSCNPVALLIGAYVKEFGRGGMSAANRKLGVWLKQKLVR